MALVEVRRAATFILAAGALVAAIAFCLLGSSTSGAETPRSVQEKATRATSAETCSTNPTTPAGEATVHLDESGKVVDWDQAIAQYKDVMQEPLRQMAVVSKNSGMYANITKYRDQIMSASGSYADEMQQAADALGADLTEVVNFNIFYELAGGCTGTLAGAEGGGVVHGRNLDYQGFGGLERAVLRVTFASEATGEALFTCATWPGYVGCLTGVRAGGISVSLNQRYAMEGAMGPRQHITLDQALLDNWFAAFPLGDTANYDGAHAYSFFLRDLLHDASVDFDQALQRIVTAPFIVPAYIVLGGVRDDAGAVVYTARAGGEAQTFRLAGEGYTSSSYPCTPTYCLVTNFDQRQGAGDFSPAEAFRIKGGRDNLAAALASAGGVGLSAAAMLDEVMTQCPTQTTDFAFSIFSAAMLARTGEMIVVAQVRGVDA